MAGGITRIKAENMRVQVQNPDEADNWWDVSGLTSIDISGGEATEREDKTFEATVKSVGQPSIATLSFTGLFLPNIAGWSRIHTAFRSTKQLRMRFETQGEMILTEDAATAGITANTGVVAFGGTGAPSTEVLKSQQYAPGMVLRLGTRNASSPQDGLYTFDRISDAGVVKVVNVSTVKYPTTDVAPVTGIAIWIPYFYQPPTNVRVTMGGNNMSGAVDQTMTASVVMTPINQPPDIVPDTAARIPA